MAYNKMIFGRSHSRFAGEFYRMPTFLIVTICRDKRLMEAVHLISLARQRTCDDDVRFIVSRRFLSIEVPKVSHMQII
jgi:hypothetical protein